MTERSFEKLTEVVEAAQAAKDPQDALDRIVLALREEFTLWSASLLRFVSQDAVRTLATWSTSDSILTVGTDLSVHFTEDTLTTAQTLLRGYPVVFRADDVDFGILSSLMEKEGAASVAVIPLHVDGTVGAILSLTSASPGALSSAAIPFLTGLGRGVEKKVMQLILGAERSQHPAGASGEDAP